jgi:hypothetical protein
MFGAMILGVTATTLRLLVRCPVCGLQLATSPDARARSRRHRLRWFRSLDTCPACDDDGRATAESRQRWQDSGRLAVQPYWSAQRLALTGLFLIAFACAFVGLASHVRMNPSVPGAGTIAKRQAPG